MQESRETGKHKRQRKTDKTGKHTKDRKNKKTKTKENVGKQENIKKTYEKMTSEVKLMIRIKY